MTRSEKHRTAHARYESQSRFAQREAFANRRFVDLDDPDPRRFKVLHLVADRQRDLFADRLAREVVTYKRPFAAS